MITLIFIGDLKFCPYLKRYTERLDLMETPYEVLLWERTEELKNKPANYYVYKSPSKISAGKLAKLHDFLGYRKWVINHIKKHRPSGIVLLSTLAGIILCNHLKDIPYIFDIRDYSYENYLPFYWIEKRIIKNSYFTAISSKGFQAFLPEHDYVIAHNFNRNEILNRSFKKQQPIKVVWNGLIRFFPYQKQMIDAVANDERFELIYHGDGPQLPLFENYCKEQGIKNVTFTGAYPPAEKVSLILGADIINNCYGGKGENRLDYAISNKFYDGIMFNIPQIVETNNYKANLVQHLKVGTPLDLSSPTLAEDLYKFYQSIDEQSFNETCKSVMQDIIAEDDYYIARIDQFIKDAATQQ